MLCSIYIFFVFFFLPKDKIGLSLMSPSSLDDVHPEVNVRKKEPFAAAGAAVSHPTHGDFPGRMKQG